MKVTIDYSKAYRGVDISRDDARNFHFKFVTEADRKNSPVTGKNVFIQDDPDFEGNSAHYVPYRFKGSFYDGGSVAKFLPTSTSLYALDKAHNGTYIKFSLKVDPFPSSL